MDPELVDQVERIDGDEYFKRYAEQKKGQIKDPAKNEAGTGLPQCSRQVVVFALVMHGMRCPQYRNLVAATMRPVVTKIESNQGQRPQCDAARRQVEPGEVPFEESEVGENERPDYTLHKARKITCRGAEHACAQTVQRVIRAIVSAPAHTIDHQLGEQCEYEKRDGKRNQVHGRDISAWQS